MDSYEGALEVELRIEFRLVKPFTGPVLSARKLTPRGRRRSWFPAEELDSRLLEFLEKWKRDRQFVPANALDGRYELVKRAPDSFDVEVLRSSTVYAIGYVAWILDFILNSDDRLERGGAIFNEVVIESLEYGSVTGNIFMSAAFAVNLMSSILTIDNALVDRDSHRLLVPVKAECSLSAKEEENLAKLILQKLDSSPEAFIDQANNSCVQLRQQVINHFVDQPIAVDGLYGDETMDAEDRIAKQLGVESEDIPQLYKAMAEALKQPRLNIKIPEDVSSPIEVKTNSLLGKVYPRKKPPTNSDTTFTPK
ncbi:hypothetical protein [Thalassospira xiamenensis]|uniref:hypothetical protein n=1 Tax=Thalassospira xiamenensis TaxID=220697 RepID=UPI003AA8DB40